MVFGGVKVKGGKAGKVRSFPPLEKGLKCGDFIDAAKPA